MKKELPTLILSTHWRDYTLFNIKRNKYVFKPLEFFVNECNFFLSNKKTYLKQDVSPIFREILILRYYGTVACPQIINYVWPQGTTICNRKDCHNMCLP